LKKEDTTSPKGLTSLWLWVPIKMSALPGSNKCNDSPNPQAHIASSSDKENELMGQVNEGNETSSWWW